LSRISSVADVDEPAVQLKQIAIPVRRSPGRDDASPPVISTLFGRCVAPSRATASRSSRRWGRGARDPRRPHSERRLLRRRDSDSDHRAEIAAFCYLVITVVAVLRVGGDEVAAARSAA